MSKPGKELYVGSLSYDVTEYELEKLFAVSGKVTSIHLITDAVTGQFKGCGYVRMSTEAEARDAIDSLDGAWLFDKRITVSYANPQKMKPGGGGVKGRWIPKGKGATSAGEGAKPRAAQGAAAKPAAKPATKPAAKPAEKPAASSSPLPAKTAARAAAKPSTRPATKPTAKPSSRPSASAASERPSAAKPRAAKPAGSKPGSSRPAADKTGFSRAGSSKPGTGRPKR